MFAFGSCSGNRDAAHDMEICFHNGDDFSKLKSECQRNPGHKKFASAASLAIDNLPEKYRDSELLEFVQVFADLTVRVLVTHTSKDRPKTFPRTDRPYPAHDLIGTGCIRAGSGWVRNVFVHSPDDAKKETCPCSECKASGNPRKVWGTIEIPTANHLVFNTEEAKHTQVDLFYGENAENPGKLPVSRKLEGYRLWYNNIKDDKSWMYCATHDMDLCEQLQKLAARRDELFSKVLEKYAGVKDAQLTIIASHPHGCDKQISMGEWATKELTVDSPWWARATYTSIACPGTSGAPVWSLGKKEIEAWRVAQ